MKHIEEFGLAVYGPNVDLESGQLLGGYRNYSAEDIVEYRHLVETNGIYEENQE